MDSNELLADVAVSITDLKKNPVAALQTGQGSPIVVLNHNKPAIYCLSPEAYEELLEAADNHEIAKLIEQRLEGDFVEVSLDEL